MSDPRLSVIPAGAVTDPNLEGRDLQVLCLLGRHIDDAGWCRRSQVKMAREIGCARSTVQASLGRLITAGWVQQREEMRPSGGDTAHSYRVVLDREPAPKKQPESQEGGADLSAGVPTQERQGVPMHASAPMLTTPLNEGEREGARDDAEDHVPNAAWLDEIRTAALTTPYDSRSEVDGEWRKLSVAERKEASGLYGPWLVGHGKIGRQKIAGVATYLREKRWQAIAAKAKPAGGRVVFEAFSRDFWIVFAKRAPQGRLRIGFMVEQALKGLPNSVDAAEAPTDAEREQFWRVDVGADEWVAWERYWAGRHVPLPRPTFAKHAWMPSQWPPDEQTADAFDEASEVMG